jgi:hypothetical protein
MPKQAPSTKLALEGNGRTSAAGKAIYCAAVPMARLNCALKVQTRSPIFEIAYARAQRLDDARPVGMGNDARKFERHVGGAFLVVGGADAGGAQPDEHLTRPGAGNFHVADLDYLFGKSTFFVPARQHVILHVFGRSSPAYALVLAFIGA